MNSQNESDDALVTVINAHSGSVLAVLMAQFMDMDLAEDALHDAISEALVSWRRNGAPQNGAGWLLTTARRRAIDRIRRSTTARSELLQQQLRVEIEDRQDNGEESGCIPDERLRLIFLCCHPALSPDARVCLTLRTVCGLSTSEIARAFLVTEATMTKRLTRAKAKIRDDQIPYEIPDNDELPKRFESVLEVIYLIFNEGFAATSGSSPTRADLCQEAIRLGRILYRLMPDSESGGLLALMLLHDARRDARADNDGNYVPLDKQDRTCWNDKLIEEGRMLIRQCLLQQRPGPYQIQAAISAVHCEATSTELTDWNQIVGLYDVLASVAPSPVVTLNKAVAIANAGDLTTAMTLITTISEELQSYQPLHAAQADLLRRSGHRVLAGDAYQKAIALSKNTAERAFLQRRLENLGLNSL